jgi:PAS domain S-box-containing protein
MRFPYREKMHACIHPETYKYFFEKTQVEAIWLKLEKEYGPRKTGNPFGVVEIDCEKFFFRSVAGGNPVTVIRKQKCVEKDVLDLHKAFAFQEGQVDCKYRYLKIGILEADPAGNIITVNDDFCRAYKCEAADLAGKNLEFLFKQTNRRDLLSLHSTLSSYSEGLAEIGVVTLVIGDRSFYSRLRLVRENNCWMIFCEQIGNGEDDLIFDMKSKELRWDAITKRSRDGIIFIDKDNRIVECNVEFFQSMKLKNSQGVSLTEASILGRDFFELLRAEVFAEIQAKIEEVKAVHTLRFQKTCYYNGRYFDVQLNPVVMPAIGYIGSSIVFRDISTTKELEELRVKTAHEAGMSQIATEVLHNVGNVLNSANVGLETIIKKFENSVVGNLHKANDLLLQNQDRFADFFTTDPRGPKLIQFFLELGMAVESELKDQKGEASELMKKLQLIKDIISTQQAYAKTSAEFKESLSLAEVVESALTIQSSSMNRHEIQVVKIFSDVPPVLAQRSKLVHVVLNLIKNAKEAMMTTDGTEKVLALEIGKSDSGFVFLKVTDTGVGITSELLPSVFSHGFTTKKDGHGFGLHFCANAAMEMGAKISVSSKGQGAGASFQIEFDTSGKMDRAA